MPIQVYLVDSHEVVRTGLSLAYANEKGLQIVGQQSSLSQAFEEIIRLRPNVVVTDWATDREDNGDRIRQLRSALPDTRILVFTVAEAPETVQTILNCGASGYLVKDASLYEVLAAVHALHAGRVFISHQPAAVSPPNPKSLTRALSARPMPGQNLAPSSPAAADDDLSYREQQVIALLAEGLTNKEVAERLFLSIKTVETYRARIMKKHGLRGRSDLFRFARSRGHNTALQES
jgi:DNA-binding NarL/FixJ family response regulator